MNENARVNLIYFWEKNKGIFERALEIILFPLWFPLLIICLPFMMMQEENYEDDLRWCKSHGKEYPGQDDPWPSGHSIVRGWKKEEKRRQREEEKERIRRRLRLQREMENENAKRSI